jgi:SAM-dependent methyltransferase/methyltransferase-like protein
MPLDAQTSYDEVPYPSSPYPYSHPDHLAAIAMLFGLHPQQPDRARILEVGCADGANLIPLALTLPESHFTGIDLSERQITVGRETIAQLGLTNIELAHADLLEFGAPTGSFDYIIAHGVLSWTPPAVQERLFAICRRSLAPHGIAFVSYNVYPGWQRRTVIREWLLRATAAGSDGRDRAQIARRMMRRLHDALQDLAHDEARQMQTELRALLEWNDGYLLHDLLEAHNQPFTFGEFLKRTETHQLRFFAEADFAAMAGADLPPEVVSSIDRSAATPIGREQLLDQLSGRAFRQSLLCHAELQPANHVAHDTVHSMYVISTLKRAATAGGSSVRFTNQRGFALNIERPQIIAALDRLAACWPKGAYFHELAAAASPSRDASHSFPADGPAWQRELAAILVAGFAERAVELHILPPAYSLAPGEFPQASPLARLQARRGTKVTNLRHDLVNLSSNEANLLMHLDGARHRASLGGTISGMIQSTSQATPNLTDAATFVNQTLDRFARQALLLA